MTISLVRPGLAVAAVALVAACGSSGGGKAATSTPPSSADTSAAMPSMDMSPSAAATTTSGTADASAEPTIHIKDFQFSEPSAPIKAGEKFIVINDDSAPHTYESVKKGFFDSGTISPGGGQKEVTAPAAGTYDVKCDFHPSMHGSLTVA